MNILYLADPNSIHDIKWMSYFSTQEGLNCFLVARNIHITRMKSVPEFERQHDIKIEGGIPDFSLVRFWSAFKLYAYIRKIIKTRKIDLVHVMYAEPNALISLLVGGEVTKILTTRGTDILVTIKAFSTRRDLHGRIVSKAYKNAFQKFHYITCTSQSQLREIDKYIENNPLGTRTELVRTGVDMDLVHKTSGSNMQSIVQQEFILFPRNMRPIYNHELAIDAIALLPDRIRLTHQFIFIDSDSTDTAYVDRIRAKMRETGGAKFKFLPAMVQDDIFALYSAASLVVMTTKSDGSPVSAMETMLFKTPLILPPLDYDEALFGNVRKFTDWTANSLAQTITNTLDTRDIRREEINYAVIASNCDRAAEMKKIQNMYNSPG